MTRHFNDYFAELGVQRQLIAPYSPPQNGIIEWRNQMVVGAPRCMPKVKELPGMFWGGGGHDGCLHPQLVIIEGSQ
jgi:hypothetical protein